ncbi:hypothetical protein [Desulfovibrio intestinalis]|uniref:Uncharacterized protein n=1 Tax=Desulfovibrio intestinalis TaxID=58621 RepID=A0A7W8C3U8_9BACT|nr:hypothetical protein [Desulfovibrio intestinalis]MBB5143952.1 hypothetical protein [Desulfovibrio intestinalis]
MISDTTTSARYRVTNGVLSYGIPFRIYSGTDVAVFWSADARADTELTLGTHYTVTILTEGGTVNLLPGVVPVGSILAVVSNIPATQEADFSSTSTVSTEALETQLDRTVQMIQQLNYMASRSVVLPATSDETPQEVLHGVYAARDDAEASASTAATSENAAAASADNAASQANAAAASASEAAQSALEAAGAVPDNLVERVTATETKNTEQDGILNAHGDRLDSVESGITALSTTLIGCVIPMFAADGYVPNGCVLPDAAEYTESQFPTFYTDYLAAGRIVTCTYAEFAAQVALTGDCGKFALDQVSKKFKVPLYKDGDSITHAASTAEIGRSVQAGAPNATGKIGLDASIAKWVKLGTKGVFEIELDPEGTAGNSNSYVNTHAMTFDLSRASSVYRDDITTVQTDGVRLRHFVVLASSQNNASVFDWSAYMAALAGKANVALDNLTAPAEHQIRERTKLVPLGSRSTTGEWTLTDVAVGRLLLLVWVPASATQDAWIQAIVTSGAVLGSWPNSPNTGMHMGTYTTWGSTNVMAVKPTSDTVVINIRSKQAGTLYAEQL